MFYENTTKQKGFTLIELLVVISIIGLLASIVLVSLNSARAKARDVKRLSELRQVQTALELYFSDHDSYPGTTSWVHDCSGNSSWSNLFNSALSPYLAKTPNDPLSPNDSWPLCFYYKLGDYGQCSGTGHSYTMLFATETSVFDLKKYNIQGEGGTAARYCLHPD